MNIALKTKELNERRATQVKAAQLITNAALTEKRDFTADEQTKLNGLHTEIESIQTQIGITIRQAAIESQKAPQLSTGEQRDLNTLDFRKVLTHLHRCAKGQPSTLDGIESEILSEGAREASEAGIETGGLMLPRMVVRRGGNSMERRDMTASGGSGGDQGGMTIATSKVGLLDDFYNASVMRQAGATVLENLVGNLDLPKFIAGTAAAKKAENAASDEVSPTTGMLSLSPKRLPAYVDISERLLKQSSVAIEAVIRANLTAQMLATQEAAFFHGGGTDEANGIAGTSGIGSVAGGTNGAAPTLAHFIALETAVDTQNALLGNLRYISNGQIRGKVKGTLKVASTDSRMLLDTDGLINGYQPLFTNAVSRTLTKGSASAVCSAIFFGNFSDYYIGYWGGVSLEMVRDKTNAISGLYTLVASSYYDGGVVRAKSFAAMLDALGA